MALVTGILSRRDVPHEKGEWFEFRRLSWQELEEARRSKQASLLPLLREMRDVLPAPDVSSARQSVDNTDPSGYDAALLLKYGIVSWSYDAPVTPDTLRSLDEPTATWAVSQVLDVALGVSKNGLNGSSTFTVS